MGEIEEDLLLLATEFVESAFAEDSQHRRLTALRRIFRLRTFHFQEIQLEIELQSPTRRIGPLTDDVLRVSLAGEIARRSLVHLHVKDRIEWTSTLRGEQRTGLIDEEITTVEPQSRIGVVVGTEMNVKTIDRPAGEVRRREIPIATVDEGMERAFARVQMAGDIAEIVRGTVKRILVDDVEIVVPNQQTRLIGERIEVERAVGIGKIIVLRGTRWFESTYGKHFSLSLSVIAKITDRSMPEIESTRGCKRWDGCRRTHPPRLGGNF